MTLKEAKKNIGRKVIYTPYDGCSIDLQDVGTITSVNDKFVFVKYGYSNTSIATSSEDLELEFELYL